MTLGTAPSFGLINAIRARYLDAMIEREIEVFRAGTPAARGITPEQLAEVATFDCSTSPVGVCFGHPKNDTPAAGTISSFRAEGNSLFATVKTLTDKAVDGIKSGEWLNRSMAFFDPTHEANPRPGKWSPRHVGLLGAAAPGIPGMGSLTKALAFDADGGLVVEDAPADAVIYAGAPTPIHTIFEAKEPAMADQTTTPTAEELAQRGTDLTARETEFSARMKRQFEAGNGTAIDALVRDGKVLPAEVDGLKLAFNSLDAEAEELTFGAGDKETKATAVSHLLAFMAQALPKRVDVSGNRLSPATEFSAPGGADTSDPQAAGRAVTAAARELMDKDKSLTFEAAVERVSAAA